MKKTFLASILSLTLFFILGAALVMAQGDGGANTGNDGGTNAGFKVTIDNPFACGNDCTLFKLAEMIVNNIILPLGGVLAVLSFIYSGFLYVTAQGSDSKIATAHKALLYTSIGTAVLLGAWTFTQVIERTIDQLKSP